MANYPNYDLFGKRPAESYRNLVQFNSTASNLVDSFGDNLAALRLSASYLNAPAALVIDAFGGDMVINRGYGELLLQNHQISSAAVITLSRVSQSFVQGGFATNGVIRFIANTPGKPELVAGSIAGSHIVDGSNFTGSAMSFFVTADPADSMGEYIEAIRLTSDRVITLSGSVKSLQFGFSGSLFGTASNAVSASWAPRAGGGSTVSASWASASLTASNVYSDTLIAINSQDSIDVLAVNNIFLYASYSLDIKSENDDISMYPSTSVNISGDLDFTGTLTQNGSTYIATSSLSSISSSYALSASWARSVSLSETASYFNNGNGSTINGNGLANLGNIISNDSSIPVIGLLSGTGFYQDEVHGRIGFNGRFDDTQPASYFESSRIEGRKDANSPNYGGALVLMTADSSGSMQECIEIDKTGNTDFKGTLSVNGTPGLTTTVYLTTSFTTMSFVNGLLISVT